jgi:hypothetical protein
VLLHPFCACAQTPVTDMAFWSKTKETSKTRFDKLDNLVDKLGAPVNRLSNKIGSEAFWPTTLDIESDKAARILKSFCSKQIENKVMYRV